MKFSAKTQALHDLIAPAVAACNVDLWGIEFLPQGSRSLLRVYIDKPASKLADAPVASGIISVNSADSVATTDSIDATTMSGDSETEDGRGIGVQDCVKVTHQVSGIMDVHDPISGEYALEVSSPGWDRPFFSLAQMQDYVGQNIALRLISAVSNRRKMTATLLQVTDEGIVVESEGQNLTIDGDNIDKANLVYED